MKPLSQPTMSGLKNEVNAVDNFVASFEKPTSAVIIEYELNSISAENSNLHSFGMGIYR
jgi:hypothetical protein